MVAHGKPFQVIGNGSDEFALRLCSALQLDPDKTSSISLTIEPGIGAVARWDGVQTVPLDVVSRVFSGAVDPWDEEHPDEVLCGAVPSHVITSPCDLLTDHSGPHRNAEGINWVDSTGSAGGP